MWSWNGISDGGEVPLSLLLVASRKNKGEGEREEMYAEFYDDEDDLDKDWDKNEDNVSYGGTMESTLHLLVVSRWNQ